MRAAKRMPRSRQKEKNGRIVCQHLLEMLADNTAVEATGIEYGNVTNPVRGMGRYWVSPMHIEADSRADRRSRPDRQFSLLF